MKATSSNPPPFFFVVVLLVPLLVAPPSDAAMTCDDVTSDIGPCIHYLLYGGSGRGPSDSCCVGIRKLAKDATTIPDLRTACGCVKPILSQSIAPGGTADFLPGRCGVVIPYVFGVHMDCNKITLEPKEVFLQGLTSAEA